MAAPAPASIRTYYTELPTNFPANLSQLARDITANGTTQYEKALLPQNWFRKNFTYDLEVQRGHGINAIEAFLNQRKGYCEQFAGTYAAFARPRHPGPGRGRVHAGTAGPDGLYHVEGKHAHAWPEVYFTGIGCAVRAHPDLAPRATRSSPACPSSKSVSSRSRRPRPRWRAPPGSDVSTACWRPTATSAWPTCLSPTSAATPAASSTRPAAGRGSCRPASCCSSCSCWP